MKSVSIKGADSTWNNNIKYLDPRRKYHKYFRQKDTLMAIPRMLEQDLQNKDPDQYEALVAQAEEERSKINVDSIIKVYPEEANFFKKEKEEPSGE